MLFHTQLNYNFLKVFGYTCYSYLRPYNNHKLQYCFFSYTFLSYSDVHKGY